MDRPPLKLMLNPIHLVSLGFGSGYSPLAPGTAGTCVGVVIYLLIKDLPPAYYITLVVFFFLIGTVVCRYTAEALGRDDHPAIVWDEVVGYLVVMFHAPPGWGWMVAGFLLFRAFDITKPWPINLADTYLKSGTGIMTDDLIAGIFSLTVVQIIAYIL